MVHDEVDDPSHNVGGDLPHGRGGNGKVVNVQLEVSLRPAFGRDFDNSAKQNAQLGSREARSSRNATRGNEDAREDTFDPNGPPKAVGSKREPKHHEGVAVPPRSADEMRMGNALERLDEVKQRGHMGKLVTGRGLGLERRNPRRPLRTHALAPEKERGGVRSFPSLRNPTPGAHPYPHNRGKQADRSQPTVRLGQQDDEDDPDAVRPASNSLAGHQNDGKGAKRAIGQPRAGARPDVVGPNASGSGKSRRRLAEQRASQGRRRLLVVIAERERGVLNISGPLRSPTFGLKVDGSLVAQRGTLPFIAVEPSAEVSVVEARGVVVGALWMVGVVVGGVIPLGGVDGAARPPA
jgi:hypothetical protein